MNIFLGYKEGFTYIFQVSFSPVVGYISVVDIGVKSKIMDHVLHSSELDRLIIYSDSEGSASENNKEDVAYL